MHGTNRSPRGVLCCGLAWLLLDTVSVLAQPFPGYTGGPLFRYDNGAVGELRELHGDGTGTVAYYDGAAVVDHETATVRDRDTSISDISPASYAILLANMEHTATKITNDVGNQCFDSQGNLAHSQNDLTTWLRCSVTMMDECQVKSGSPYPEWGPLPCWRGGSYPRVHFQEPTDTPQNSERCPLGQPGCTTPIHVGSQRIEFPDFAQSSSGLTADQATDAMYSWMAACDGGATAPTDFYDDCYLYHYRAPLMPNVPRVFGIPSEGNLPPVNQPQPAPNGLSGEVMNPGGYQGGGTEVGGGGGFTSGTGSGGGGGSDPGDGSGSDGSGTEGGDTTVTADEAAPLEGETRSIVALSQGVGWLPRTCPEPMSATTDTLGTIQLVDFGPFCAIAGWIRAMVIASAFMGAMLYALGGTRT